MSLLQAAVSSMTPPHNGGDAPEGGTAALFALASETGLTWPTGSIPGAPIGFRPGSRRVVVTMTDADFHNDYNSANPYSFQSPSYAQAVVDLNAIGAKAAAVFVTSANPGEAEAFASLRAYAGATGAVVPPSAFGAAGTYNTGIGGASLLPDAPGGFCYLVFQISSDGTGLGAAFVNAIDFAAAP
jgi:hypothetical protein